MGDFPGLGCGAAAQKTQRAGTLAGSRSERPLEHLDDVCHAAVSRASCLW